MKCHTLAVPVGIGTFALGVTLAAIVYLHPVERLDPPQAVVASPLPPPESVTCRDNSSAFPGRSKPLDSLKKYKNGYFPEKAFDDGWRGADGSFDDWYGKHLRAMKEPSLVDVKDPDSEVYRFLWLRTFHHPISVRIVRTGYSFRLTSVELNGAGGYDPGRNLRTDNVEIFNDEWCQFTALLDKAQFWAEPTVNRELSGFDGSQWVFEGVNDGRYHIVDRWTPREGAFREACIYLLKLSGRDEKSLGNDLY
jgi:hypothetical protein